MDERAAERSRPGIRLATACLAMLFFLATALVGCDDTQTCFPLNGSCTDASGFSDFFQQGVSCCEGTCTQISGPPVSSGPVARLCQ